MIASPTPSQEPPTENEDSTQFNGGTDGQAP